MGLFSALSNQLIQVHYHRNFERGVMIKTVEAQDSGYRFMPGVSQ